MEEYSKKKRAILIAAGSFYGLPFSVSEEDLVIAVSTAKKKDLSRKSF